MIYTIKKVKLTINKVKLAINKVKLADNRVLIVIITINQNWNKRLINKSFY